MSKRIETRFNEFHIEVKSCGKCHIEKSLSHFTKNSQYITGYTSWCKDCHNEYNRHWGQSHRPNKRLSSILSRFRPLGLTKEKYFELQKQQNNECKICGRKPKEEERALAVDHCHKTNKIRGLLCSFCNRLLGLSYDNPEILLKAVAYLKETQ